MVYDIFAAYNCPVDKVIYIFYEIITRVNLFSSLIFVVFKNSNNVP